MDKPFVITNNQNKSRPVLPGGFFMIRCAINGLIRHLAMMNRYFLGKRSVIAIEATQDGCRA
jgi:hypothetical protein